jgi:calcium/calmodulin-dependent protein kinase I
MYSTSANYSQQALKHVWLSGKTASDHNLLPEIRAYVTKARLRRGIEKVKLANRIEALRMQEDEGEAVSNDGDVPTNAVEAAGEALAAKNFDKALTTDGKMAAPATGGSRLSRLARGAIFREVVLAKVREEKEQKLQKEFEEKAAAEAAKKGSSSH